jgi:hypothetical protein
MMKLLAYKINNQPIGTVIKSWNVSQLNGNTPFLISEQIIDGYEDISSIETWDQFGYDTTNDIGIIVNAIKEIYEDVQFDNLSNSEKKIVSKWFVNTKLERNTIKTEEEQIDDATLLSELIQNNKILLNGIININNIDYIKVSGGRSYGEMYFQNNNVPTILSKNVPTKIVGTTIPGDLFGFLQNSDKLIYIEEFSNTFQVVSTISFETVGNALTDYVFYIVVNGSILGKSSVYRKLNSGDMASITISSLISLKQNDYIELYVENLRNNSNVLIKNMNLNIK